jgi:3-oxoacyl-[acyl-carrier-protein] synthase II
MGSRVVVTGVGVVNGLCVGGGAVIGPALETGCSAVREVAGFSTDRLPCHLAAELSSSTVTSLVDPVETRRMSRVSQMTVASCRLALRDAGLDGASEVNLVVGSEFGDQRSTEEFAAGYLKRGIAGLSPLAFPNTVMNTMAAVTAIALGIRGATVTLNARRVAGELAVARAVAMVASGQATRVLAGGVDEISPLMFAALAELGVLSPGASPGIRSGESSIDEACRPFDQRANGQVRGEGATFVVIELLERAVARGAPILAEIRSAVWRGGRRDGAAAAAVQAAGLAFDEVGWIYGGAPGDPAEDAAELTSVRRAFGKHAPALTALAPVAGEHAGLGAFRVAAGTWTARSGRLPGIATLLEPRAGARGLIVGPGAHNVPFGPGLVAAQSRSDSVALVIAPV